MLSYEWIRDNGLAGAVQDGVRRGLRLANDMAQDVTIKNATSGNPAMTAKLAEMKKGAGSALDACWGQALVSRIYRCRAAWQQRDLARLATRSHHDGRYDNTPFQVQRGIAALKNHCKRAQLRDDVQVRSVGISLVARKPEDYLPRKVLDGLLLGQFADGLCTEPRIWKHSLPHSQQKQG